MKTNLNSLLAAALLLIPACKTTSAPARLGAVQAKEESSPKLSCRLSILKTNVAIGSDTLDFGLIDGVTGHGGSSGPASQATSIIIGLMKAGDLATILRNEVPAKYGTLVARVSFFTSQSQGTISSAPENDRIPHLLLDLGWVKNGHVQVRTSSKLFGTMPSTSLTLPISSDGLTASLVCTPLVD